jgi:hypothetical protein
VEIWTANKIGGKERYFFDDAKIEIDRGKGVKTIPIADIERVNCIRFAEIRGCELQLRDGTKQLMSVDVPSTEFKPFIEALHVKLAEHGGIEFVRGSWLVVGVLAAIGVMAIIAGWLIYTGVLVPPEGLRAKAFMIMIAGAIWVVLGPALVWRSRPRPYDPRAPLDVLA